VANESGLIVELRHGFYVLKSLLQMKDKLLTILANREYAELLIKNNAGEKIDD
jgi:hypothetical protein